MHKDSRSKVKRDHDNRVCVCERSGESKDATPAPAGAACVSLELGLRLREEGDHKYSAMDVQPWDIFDGDFSPEENMGYHRGVIVQYLLRSRDLRDLKKARHHLDKLITLKEGYHVEG